MTAALLTHALVAAAPARAGDAGGERAKCRFDDPGCAQPEEPDGAATNWAREYVELRVQEMNARALGGEAAALLREARVVGGTVAKPASNPFQVGLLLKWVDDNFYAQYCGGTLVAPNFIVTAAHCSDFLDASEVQVLTGARRLDGEGVRRDVTRITIHPSWNPSTFDYDVAVWELSSYATGLPLAKLARRDPGVGKKLLATGWGNTEEFGYPIDLMQVKVPLVARDDCNDANSYQGLITARMICAGLTSGGKDTCQGDSGGPLTRKRGGKFRELVGITSWGSGCADPELYGVYTRVSRVRDFIDSVIQ